MIFKRSLIIIIWIVFLYIQILYNSYNRYHLLALCGIIIFNICFSSSDLTFSFEKASYEFLEDQFALQSFNVVLEEFGHVAIPNGVTITVTAEIIETMSNATSKASKIAIYMHVQ